MIRPGRSLPSPLPSRLWLRLERQRQRRAASAAGRGVSNTSQLFCSNTSLEAAGEVGFGVGLAAAAEQPAEALLKSTVEALCSMLGGATGEGNDGLIPTQVGGPEEVLFCLLLGDVAVAAVVAVLVVAVVVSFRLGEAS